MKKLILPLIFLPLSALALDEMRSVTETGIKNRLMTTVKDTEVERMLGSTAEFNECKEKNKFDPKDNATTRSQKLADATACFKKKVTGKNGDALKKLAEDMKLESYGLVKSKEVNDITVYLSKKMTKALTGRDPDDKSAEALKWENQKIVDQKVFIDLYTNQLVKSALFEVSRFCFEKLRNTSGEKNFAQHWPKSAFKMTTDSSGNQVPDISILKDNGDPSFFADSTNVDLSKKEDAYKHVISGLGASVDSDTYDGYFKFCQAAIPLMCAKFRSTVSGRTESNDASKTAISVADVAIKTDADLAVGGNACLTMDKLTSIRTAMANTEKVAKQFDEMGEDKDKFALQMIQNPKLYQRGKGAGEESLDELTSMSSTDMLEGAQDSKLKDLETQCAQGGGAECDDFLVKSDGLDKAISNIETNMNLKKELEMKQVAEMVGKPDELKKYLTDNGHFDLLNQLEAGTLSDTAMAAELGKVYDARKVAEIENLKLKVGKRQMNEKDYDALSDQDKKDKITANIKESKEERARLAQVVMFNNIITSQLSLTEKDSGKNVGRNVNAWKKEAKGMENSGIDMTLFKGIQQVADKEGSKMDDASVVGGGIIDSILGKKEDKKP